MSPENIEIVKRAKVAYAAFNHRDWDGFFSDMYSEADYEWDPMEENVSYRGREAIIEYLDSWLEAWDEFEVEVEDIEVVPTADRMFVALRYRGKGKGSEIPVTCSSTSPNRVKASSCGPRSRPTEPRLSKPRQVIRLEDSWEADRIEPDQLHDTGSNVIMHNRWTTTGKGSGIDFEAQFWVVFTFATEAIMRIEFFLDRTRALEAVGLSEWRCRRRGHDDYSVVTHDE
jgi:SnoaL-like domain